MKMKYMEFLNKQLFRENTDKSETAPYKFRFGIMMGYHKKKKDNK